MFVPRFNENVIFWIELVLLKSVGPDDDLMCWIVGARRVQTILKKFEPSCRYRPLPEEMNKADHFEFGPFPYIQPDGSFPPNKILVLSFVAGLKIHEYLNFLGP